MENGFKNVEIGQRDHEVEPTRAEATMLREVLSAVRRTRHGQVQIHIQDGRVIQIDHTEKLRLTAR